MAITRGATVSSFTRSDSGTDASVSHTVDAGTTLLVVSTMYEAAETVSGTPSWSQGGGESLTLVDETTRSGSSADMCVSTFALLNPTAGAGTVTVTHSTNDNAITVATNYIGAAAISLLEEDVNDATTATMVFASGGAAGSALYVAGGFKGGDGDPSSNDASFTELFDSASGTSTSADISGYVCDLLDNAPIAVTCTWSATDENAGHYLEIHAPITVSPGVGGLSFDGRGVTGGVITDRAKAGWGVGLAFTGQPVTIDVVAVGGGNHEITAGAVDPLLLTGAAPTAIYGINRTPGIDTLEFTGSTPTLAYSWTVKPDKDDLQFAGTTPIASVGINRTPGIDTLEFDGKIPTLAYSWNVKPTTGSLEFTGNIPTLAYSWTVFPDKDALEFTGVEPTVKVGIVRTPTTGSLEFTGNIPIAEEDHIIDVGLDALEFNSDVPLVFNGLLAQPTAGSLEFTGNIPTLAYSWTVFPDKDTLEFTGAAPTSVYGTNRTPTTGSLILNGSIPTLSFSVFPSTGSLALTGLTPDRIYGINRTPTTASLTFSGITPTLAYSWTVKPTTGSLALSGKTPASIYGIVRNPTTGSLTTTGEQVYLGNLVTPGTGSLTITTYQASVNKIDVGTGSIAFTGESIARINVANSGRSITNPSATTSVPSNYEQCDYTGFRQLPGSLKMTWNKHAVRKKSWESRHPQDVLRSVPERQKGSKRPEQADTFIDTAVEAEDL